VTEVLYATSHIAGTFTSPENADGNTPTTWAGQLNTNASQTSRWAIGDPVDPLTAAATQTIRVVARKGSNSGTPTIALNLYEAGALVQSLVGATGVTDQVGQDITGNFDSSAITDRAAVEVEVVMSAVAGSGTVRNSAQVSLIEWTADTSVSADTDVDAGVAAATGAASGAAVKVSPVPATAAGAGAAQDATVPVGGLISGAVGINPQTLSCAVGERLVCIAHSRGGATGFAVTPNAGGASWVNRVAEATLPTNDTARRSLAVAELVPESTVTDEVFTASWSGDSTDAIWLRVPEGGSFEFVGASVGDSDTGTVTSQATGAVEAPAGDLLLVTAAVIRDGGAAGIAWTVSEVNPALDGGGNLLLDNYAGKGAGGNSGAAGYLSLTGQSADSWSDTVTLPGGDGAKQITAALVAWSTAAAGAADANAGEASVSAAAAAPAAKVEPATTAATAAGAAADTTAGISPTPAAAAGTAAGLGVSARVAPAAPVAGGSGAGLAVTSRVAPTGGSATGSAAANDATVVAGAMTNAPAGNAAASAAAQDPAAAVGAVAQPGTTVASANGAGVATGTNAPAITAAASAVANGGGVATSRQAPAQLAAAAGSAPAAVLSVLAAAGAAAALGSVPDVQITGAPVPGALATSAPIAGLVAAAAPGGLVATAPTVTLTAS
jgi:hypothetical protein